jgi:hypothetical protein
MAEHAGVSVVAVFSRMNCRSRTGKTRKDIAKKAAGAKQKAVEARSLRPEPHRRK